MPEAQSYAVAERCLRPNSKHVCLADVSQVTKIRKMYERIISEKHEDTMAKFGAIIAQGIIDAGTPGRRRPLHHSFDRPC